jgi:DeoR/GlpR family transcriptional regulator of sugar metabolism
MILEQRQQQIAELIPEFRGIRVASLGEELGISSATDTRQLR